MDSIICKRLKQLRKKNKKSQLDVAQALGVSRAHIANWESGRRELNIADAIKIVKFYGVTLDYLAGLED